MLPEVTFNGSRFLILWLIAGLILGLIDPQIVGSLERLVPVDARRWSGRTAWHALQHALPDAVLTSAAFGLVGALAMCIGTVHLLGLLGGLLLGLRMGVGTGLFLGLGLILGPTVRGFIMVEVPVRAFPNHGTRRSMRNAILHALTLGLVLAVLSLVMSLAWALAYRPLFEPAFAFENGLLMGLVVGFFRGGGTFCVQHLIIRFLLSQSKSTPFDYVRFLDYAADRIFLRKVGGGYIFIHRMLMEYFAAQYRL